LGAGGQLGKKVGEVFTARSWHTIGADIAAPTTVSQAIQFDKGTGMEAQCSKVQQALGSNQHLDAIVNVAGGFAMGSAPDANVFANMSAMLESSVNTSTIAAHIASASMKSGGLMILPGAAAAYSPTGWSLPYGTAKVAVHHLVRSLADAKAAGLPEGTKTIGIAPQTLDTPQNREAMPEADTSTWATLDEVAERLESWCSDPSAVESGKVYLIKKESGSPAVFDGKEPL
jgi:dihydropteridine reductase